MAMDASAMGALMASKLNALGFAPEDPNQVAILTALSAAIIEHIQAAAITTTPVTAGSSAGTYTGTVQ